MCFTLKPGEWGRERTEDRIKVFTQKRLEDGECFHRAWGCGKVVRDTTGLKGAYTRGGPERAMNAPKSRRVESHVGKLGCRVRVGCTSWCKEDDGIALATVGKRGVEGAPIEVEGGVSYVNNAPPAGE